MNPVRTILLGFVLVLFGFLAPFLMMLRVIQPDLLLSFLSYGASVAGLMLGVIGAASYVRRSRGRG